MLFRPKQSYSARRLLPFDKLRTGGAKSKSAPRNDEMTYHTRSKFSFPPTARPTFAISSHSP